MSQYASLFQLLRSGPLKVAILGSGNWGTAVAKLISENTAESYLFANEVTMWVYAGDMVGERSLADIINEQHENVKYLPGVSLPKNLIAKTDIHSTVKDADLLIFILPHQFLLRVAEQLKGSVKPTARAISLVKGLHVEAGIPCTFSAVLERILKIECSALSGANVAKIIPYNNDNQNHRTDSLSLQDVALGQFSESTIGYKEPDMAAIWQQLFDRPYFKANTVPDVDGVQVCGALKNLVAVAAGFCDGMNMGTNTKAALMRIGTEETRLFATLFFHGVLEETFFESSGFADVITTCFGGRNVRCAAEFIRRGQKDSWDEIEDSMLGGMKMQGQLTCKEVHEVVKTFDLEKYFPLFEVTYQIAFEKRPPQALLEVFMTNETSKVRKLADCSPTPLTSELQEVKASLHASIRKRALSTASSQASPPV